MAATTTDKAEIHRYLLEELPFILEESPDIQRTILRISGRSFADADATDRRFEQMFQELRKERELSEKRWKENQKRWEEDKQRWEEIQRQSNERFEFLVGEIKALHKKHESTLGALGSRWGIAAESSFRDGLKDLLEHDFGVQVVNVTEYDDDGEVFGRPDQIELDIIIKNGTLILCEIKSSMSRSDMYAFYRKVQFYEKRHQRNATKMMVISPMIDRRAKSVAEKLGITVHAYTDEVEL